MVERGGYILVAVGVGRFLLMSVKLKVIGLGGNVIPAYNKTVTKVMYSSPYVIEPPKFGLRFFKFTT